MKTSWGYPKMGRLSLRCGFVFGDQRASVAALIIAK
jgi:hypothetical protein